MKNNQLLRHITILTSGNTIAQIIPFLATFVLIVLFSNSILGQFFVFLSINMLLSIIVTLQFEQTIVLSANDEETNKLFTISIISCFATLSCMLSGAWLLLNLFDIPIIEQYSSILVPACFASFFNGVANSLTGLYNSQKRYTIIAISKNVRTLSIAVAQISIGFFSPTLQTLIWGYIAGVAISIVYLLFKLFKVKILSRQYIQSHFSVYKTLIVKYKNFPLYNTLITFINTLSNHVPILFISHYFGDGYAGYYGIANRIITTPTGVFTVSFQQVLLKEISERLNQGKELYGYIKKFAFSIMRYSTTFFMAAFLSAPYLFKWLKPDWIEASLYIQLLLPWLYVKFFVSPFVSTLSILNLQKKLLVYDVTLLIFRVIALYLGLLIYSNIYYSIGIYSAVGVFFNIFLIYYILKLTKKAE
ncbi:MAG: oligosaccharide flippase family protein [Bacteroidales bacterium]|nr:oligosaccharide flippase family protein [Bacteroidales bacterium]